MGDSESGEGETDLEDGERVAAPEADGTVTDPGESVVITKTIRLVSPFVFVYGLYTMFHGASSVGGGFQGGVIVASVVVTIAFAFGIDQTGGWLSPASLTAGAVTGVVVFAVVGLGSAAFGGSFLELAAYPGKKGGLYAIELLEVGIGVTVAATILVLFFELAGGFGGGE